MVSICIAAHNSSTTIRRTLSSIQNQLYKDFEVIIVDDHSTDNTCEIIENEFCAIDDRFKLYKDCTERQFIDAHNLSYELAKGEYLFRVDHDDILLNNYLLKHVEFMDKNPLIDCCSSALYVLFLGENDTIPENINFMSEYSFDNYEYELELFNKYPAYYFIHYSASNRSNWCVWHNNSSCIRKTFYDKYHPKFMCTEIADVIFWRQVLSYGAKMYRMPEHLSIACIVNSTSTFERNPVYNSDITKNYFIQYIAGKYAYEAFMYYKGDIIFNAEYDDTSENMKQLYLNTMNKFKEDLVATEDWDKLIPDEEKHLNVNYGYQEL